MSPLQTDRSTPNAPDAGQQGYLPDRLWLLGLMVCLVFLANAYPLVQAFTTGGYLYYVNGFDEATYLQFDFSQAVQGLTRPGQFLVTMLHHIGLSGGWINLLLDTVTLVVFPLISRACFLRLGWTRQQAGLGAIGMVVLPPLFTGVNPLIQHLFTWNVSSGSIFWFNVPEIATPSLLRSPEPQVSLTLLATGLYLALRTRTFWPVYAVLPVMYPFVAIPVAFAALACHLRSRWPAAGREWGPPIVTFLLVGAVAWAYYGLFASQALRAIVLESHLPLVSLTSTLALVIYLVLRRQIPIEHRFAVLMIALSPLAAGNQQLVSGYLPQPVNFEQYLGCFAAALVTLWGIRALPGWRLLVLTLGLCLFVRASYVMFRTNQATNDRLPLSTELVTALREDPLHTVVNDVALSSALNLIHPRQGPTGLGIEKTFVALSERYAPTYRCIKQQALAAHPDDEGLRRSFTHLDAAFRYNSQDVLVTHINRKQHFKVMTDVDAPCMDRAPLPLRYFLLHP